MHFQSILRVSLSALALVALLHACKKDDDSSDKEDPSTAIKCDNSGLSLATTRYSVEIKAIFDNSGCLGCHSALSNKSSGGGINLEDHAATKKTADNKTLLGSIGQLKGWKAMPQGGLPKMKDADICKVKFWVDNGAPNN
jgi:cytochrome c551/c552